MNATTLLQKVCALGHYVPYSTDNGVLVCDACARDLIWVLRFPLQEVSGWISLARASQLDYGALAEVSL